MSVKRPVGSMPIFGGRLLALRHTSWMEGMVMASRSGSVDWRCASGV
jgi:hypothetical protein